MNLIPFLKVEFYHLALWMKGFGWFSSEIPVWKRRSDLSGVHFKGGIIHVILVIFLRFTFFNIFFPLRIDISFKMILTLPYFYEYISLMQNPPFVGFKQEKMDEKNVIAGSFYYGELWLQLREVFNFT